MTTSISAVSAGTTSAIDTATKKSTLSDETKAKLAALGITATEDMTEAEAQSLIAAKEAENNAQNQTSDQGNSSESEILAEAKSLASALGIAVSTDDDVSDILDAIGSELEVMLEDAENNPSRLAQLSSYFTQLSSLTDRYDNLQTAQAGMYSAMNMVSTSNKIALGLS